MGLILDIIATGGFVEFLGFGHNENVIVSKVDCGTRKVQGIATNFNTFITFDKVDPKTRKRIASSEFNWFTASEEYSQYAYSGFVEQLTQIMGICCAITEMDHEDFMDEFYDKVDAEFGETEEIQDIILDFSNDGPQKLIKCLQETMMAFIGNLIGKDCPLLKCNLRSNKSGYTQPANEATWILSMDSEFELTRVTEYSRTKHEEAVAARNAKRNNPQAPKTNKETDGAGSEFDDDDYGVGADDLEDELEGELFDNADGEDVDSSDDISEDTAESVESDDDDDISEIPF